MLGVEVVLPDGTIWNGLRRLRKNTAGYDLKHLFIGAEGTLGIITAAVLKLRPYPHSRATAVVAVKDPGSALLLLRELETYVGETISAFELLSRDAVSSGLQMENARYPLEKSHDWTVVVEVETSARSADLQSSLEAGLAAAMEQGTVTDAVIAMLSDQRRAIWHLRESIAAFFVEDTSSLKTDTAVPVSQAPEFVQRVGPAVEHKMTGAKAIPFGHLGDGNIHVNVLRPDGMDPDTFRSRWSELSAVIEDEALALDGTVCAEHGVGRLKRKAFKRSVDPREQKLMEMIKSALDEDAMLNPGVIL